MNESRTIAVEGALIVGDAAHAQTLMTGAGFREAVTDAEALAIVLDGADSIPDALVQYQLARLRPMQQQVRGGQSFSRSMLA